MATIKHSELDYTGGGVWCVNGTLEDGSVFMGSNDYIFTIANYESGILDETDEDISIYDVDGHTCEFYYIESFNGSEAFDMWEQILAQHPKCVDLDLLKDQLKKERDKFNKKEVGIEADFSFGELEFLQKVLKEFRTLDRWSDGSLVSAEDVQTIDRIREQISVAVDLAIADIM